MGTTLGEKIKDLRSMEGLTQEALGEKLGVTSGFISQIETGYSYPSFELLQALLKLYPLDANLLFDDSRFTKESNPQKRDMMISVSERDYLVEVLEGAINRLEHLPVMSDEGTQQGDDAGSDHR